MTAVTGAGFGPPEGTGSRDLLALPADVKASIRILIVDDERTLRESCASVLRGEGYTVTLAGRGEEAMEFVRRRQFDLVLVDLFMSQVSGLEILNAALEAHRDTLVVVMTGNPTVSSSIEALRMGAWDYLPKPFSATHLQVLIGRASHAILKGREANDLRQQVMRQHSHSDTQALIGIAPSFRKAVELARKVAPTDASVFISGESGTGKEVIAQFIHQHSRRAKKTLVPINCAALPEPLLESEMFGHRKGAFTGADRDKPGLLETADGGTLFLDELTEMSLPLQAKLLRVIQDGIVRRVGAETAGDPVDVRFISATNRDPQDAVERGVLRGDLFYRLRVVPIVLPPLRSRPEDIQLLANHFLGIFWHRHRQMTDRAPRLSDSAIEFLRTRAWRGNVRELQNVIEHVAVLVEPDQLIEPTDIPMYEDSEAAPERMPAAQLDGPFHDVKDRVIAQFERDYLARLVGRAGGNMSKAARQANVDRTTLYRLMEKHGLQRDDRGE
ncbi:MAG: sigma-54-dependent Fis family transcriptional regulator [Gemmatimonadetes bacterium]|nr:sigma-54-dependent Fis family transcriptional regulator [Gemmatimonadota bacterium]MBP6442585.1 sigma-54-dependent Fis family transcriptional regulator [Gemmatimonadales bacterium]MBK9550211.1 sigma-54-dependent Fis family transcriptional regulator [Gemmatimonadota bacterium]MBP6570090.1 sigma-54-dependent Fis family transcriptional regulator [Gemmatimonadales bacterium]MBP7619710.1 sigma-54-dependent Fis family transcriptional regulator [Gemmatimonadales bacterium]